MLRLLICLFLLFSFADADLFAQKGDDYFHSGSLAFLTGDREKAKSEVERGLRIDPENSKLLALQAELDKKKKTVRISNSSGRKVLQGRIRARKVSKIDSKRKMKRKIRLPSLAMILISRTTRRSRRKAGVMKKIRRSK
jgi:hypothetical protein